MQNQTCDCRLVRRQGIERIGLKVPANKGARGEAAHQKRGARHLHAPHFALQSVFDYALEGSVLHLPGFDLAVGGAREEDLVSSDRSLFKAGYHARVRLVCYYAACLHHHID